MTAFLFAYEKLVHKFTFWATFKQKGPFYPKRLFLNDSIKLSMGFFIKMGK